MKKINLILGAVAAVALLASCSNGAKDLTNVKNIDYEYAYTVTGTMTTTDKYGTTASYSTDTTVQTIKTAGATCSYDEDALDTRNYDSYTIQVHGKADCVNTETPAGATTANPSHKYTSDFGVDQWGDWKYKTISINIPAGWYANSYENIFDYYEDGLRNGFYLWNNSDSVNSVSLTPASSDQTAADYLSGGTNYGQYFWFDAWSWSGTIKYRYYKGTYLELKLFEFDGDYFISFNNEYIALPEDALDGFIGDDEFTLKYSTKNDNRANLSETGHTNAAGNLSTTEVEYNLSFKIIDLAD